MTHRCKLQLQEKKFKVFTTLAYHFLKREFLIFYIYLNLLNKLYININLCDRLRENAELQENDCKTLNTYIL